MNDSPPPQSDQAKKPPIKDKSGSSQNVESRHRDAERNSSSQKDARRETRAGAETRHEQNDTGQSDKDAVLRHMKIETRHKDSKETKQGPIEGRVKDAAAQGRDRSARPDRLTPEQRAERAQITNRPNLVGFPSGVGDAARTEVQRVLNNVPQSLRDSPDAVLFLTGRASRTGGADFNQRLSEDRVANVAAIMKQLGVKAQIETAAYGEQDARDVGQPDNFDDKDFRSVRVDVSPPVDKGNTPDFGHEWTKEVPDFSKVDTQKEFVDRLKSVAKPAGDALRHVLSDDYAGVAKDLGKAVRASGEKLAENQEHKIRKEHINTNLVPGYLNAFESYMLGRIDSQRPAVESSPWLYKDQEKRTRAKQEANAGKYLFEQELRSKSAAEIDATRRYVQDPGNLKRFQADVRKAFNRKLNW